MKRINIDLSDKTALPVCSCGWRGDIFMNPKTAYSQALDHTHTCHSGDRAYMSALYQWQVRHAAALE